MDKQHQGIGWVSFCYIMEPQPRLCSQVMVLTKILVLLGRLALKYKLLMSCLPY